LEIYKIIYNTSVTIWNLKCISLLYCWFYSLAYAHRNNSMFLLFSDMEPDIRSTTCTMESKPNLFTDNLLRLASESNTYSAAIFSQIISWRENCYKVSWILDSWKFLHWKRKDAKSLLMGTCLDYSLLCKDRLLMPASIQPF
jgi:hypothetical protein